MSELDKLIRAALSDHVDGEVPDETPTNRLVGRFLRHSRWVTGFAWMKMSGTLLICFVAATSFFTVDTTRSQIACAAVFTVGFVGFAMWWIWYWMIFNRNDALREIKRLELQIAELRAAQTS